MYARVYFWALYFVLLFCMSICMLVPCCFDYCCFMKKKLESIMPLALFFFLKIVWLVGILCVCLWTLGLIFLFPAKKCHWDFDRECTEFEDHFGYYGHFSNIKFSSSWTSMSCYLSLLSFLSTLFCSFHFMSLSPPWLYLFQSIVFFLMVS